jgi:hypothetical protein
MGSKVIKVAATAAFLVMTTGAAGAVGDGMRDETPRVTVTLGDLSRNTQVAMNDDAGNESTGGATNLSANTNANTASNSATNTNNNSDTNTNTNANESKADASASAGAAVVTGSGDGNGGSSSTNVDGDEAATSSAAAIILSTGDDTCMGSSGIGVQGMEFGFSVGSSWTDENCVMLKNARELKNQGYEKAAKARLCMNEENAMAFELAGEPCPRALPSTQAALAKIKAMNPDYAVAAEAGPQFASTQPASVSDATAESRAVGGDADAEWLSPKIDGFLAMVRSVVDHLTHGFAAAGGDVTAMDGIE